MSMVRAPEIEIGRSGLSRPVAFALLSFSFIGFLAQGAAAYFYDLAGWAVPLQVIIAIGAAIILLHDGRALYWLVFGPEGRFPLLAGLAVAGLALSRPVVLTGQEGNMDKIGLQSVVGILIYMVTLQLVRTESWARLLLRVLFFTICASSAVGLYEAATGARMPWSVYYDNFKHSVAAVVGLESNPVPFAYAVVPVAAIAIFYSFCSGVPYANPGRWLSVATAILGTAGLLASASRSGVGGLIVGTVTCLFFSANAMFRKVILFGIPVAIGLWLASPVLIEWLSKEQNTAEDIRLYGTWLTYLPMILTHPLGVPDSADWSDAVTASHSALGMQVDANVIHESLLIAPHNAFLTAGVWYGWTGIAGLVAIYAYAWRGGMKVLKAPETSQDVRLFAVALSGSFAALLTHMWFHNASILTGEMRNWVFVGLTVGLAGIPTKSIEQSEELA